MLVSTARQAAALLVGGLLVLVSACSLDYLSSEYGKPPGGGGDIPDAGEDVDDSIPPEEPSCWEFGDPAPTFCDDFHRGIDNGWTAVIGERGGSVARAADTESLRIGVQGASKRPGSVAYVMKELSASTSRVHVTFYMVAPEAIGKTQQPVVTFELPHDGKLTQVSLVLSDDGTRVKEREVLGDGGGAPTGYAVNTKLPSDGVNIDMTVSLGTTPKLEIDFNAVQVFSRNLASSLPRAPRLRVYFGTQEAEVPTGAWELRVDDIHITAE